MDSAIINFAVYENGKELVGMADLTLPDVTFLTQTISGSGLGGNVEAVLPLIDALTATLNFRVLNKSAAQLATPTQHTLDCRGAQQEIDNVRGTVKEVAVKHLLVGTPKTFKPGKLAPASSGDTSIELALDRYTCYVEGKKTIDICARTMDCYINGVDYLKGTKKALGK